MTSEVHPIDQAIINELGRLREDARQYIAQADWTRFRSVGEQLVPLLHEHEIFGKTLNRFFGSKQLMLVPQFQAYNLLSVSVSRSPSEAVTWLRKVYSITKTDLRYVAEVHGISVADKIVLKNGVTLMPLEQLPQSRNTEASINQYKLVLMPPSRPNFSRPIGALLELREVPAIGVPQADETQNLAPPRSEELERTLRAFTLVNNAAPVVGVSWIDFSDPDLALAEVGQIWMSAIFEGLSPHTAPSIDQDAVAWVDRYLALDNDVRRVCDVAIERLNLARRRISPGNKAIEGAICLEALLLTDDETMELTYRLKLRAAFLLGKGFKDRLDISNAVGGLYTLRSKTVHGRASRSQDAKKDAACATRGLDICARALRAIVIANKKFVARDWELAGGNPESSDA